ncbi:hypothetical protein [Streptomyces phaeolivaceus]|nr:hypothetical protein [Streptomyces phaeolivaceus]
MLRLPAEQERAAYEQADELMPAATEEAWDEAVAQLLDRTAA